MADNHRDIESVSDTAVDDDVAFVRALLVDVGHRPLSARSLLLSYLLGIPRGHVPVARLVALGELFDVRPGTVRTALSRMVAAGEASADDRGYRVAGSMSERQRRQDVGVTGRTDEWDGAWWTAVVTDESRPIAERRRFRSTMEDALMGELRPDAWLRPANVPAPPAIDGVVVVRGPLASGDDLDLVTRLWDVDRLRTDADRFVDALDRLGRRLEPLVSASAPRRSGHEADVLGTTFELSAACVRFLRDEPRLPTELTAGRAIGDELRARYATVNRAFRERLVAHLDAAT